MLKRTVLLTLGLSGLLSGALAVDVSKLPPASKQAGVTFEKDIKPLFQASCTRCHGAERPKEGLRLDILEGALKGSKSGKVIEPGKSEKSKLVVAAARIDPENSMPPTPRPGRKGPPGPPPKPLTPDQVGLVRAWIDQGAK